MCACFHSENCFMACSYCYRNGNEKRRLKCIKEGFNDFMHHGDYGSV